MSLQEIVNEGSPRKQYLKMITEKLDEMMLKECVYFGVASQREIIETMVTELLTSLIDFDKDRLARVAAMCMIVMQLKDINDKKNEGR